MAVELTPRARPAPTIPPAPAPATPLAASQATPAASPRGAASEPDRDLLDGNASAPSTGRRPSSWPSASVPARPA
jgi:hypothetical protein